MSVDLKKGDWSLGGGVSNRHWIVHTCAAMSACGSRLRSERAAEGGRRSASPVKVGKKGTRRCGNRQSSCLESRSFACEALVAAYIPLHDGAGDLNKGKADAGLPVLGRFEHEVVQRVANAGILYTRMQRRQLGV